MWGRVGVSMASARSTSYLGPLDAGKRGDCVSSDRTFAGEVVAGSAHSDGDDQCTADVCLAAGPLNTPLVDGSNLPGSGDG